MSEQYIVGHCECSFHFSCRFKIITLISLIPRIGNQFEEQATNKSSTPEIITKKKKKRSKQYFRSNENLLFQCLTWLLRVD